MTGSCRLFDEAIGRTSGEVDRELRAHAARCAECAPKVSLWDGIDTAAPELQRRWESPDLFSRIASAIEQEKSRGDQLPAPRESERMHWIPIAAAAALFAIAMLGLQVFRNAGGREPLVNGASTSQPLLSDRSLEEVESAEANYVRSIENLSAIVRPQLENPTTPLLVSYREKLLVLDSAISEMRGQIESNRFNSHLRRELLAMYQEKQRTLQEVMKEGKS